MRSPANHIAHALIAEKFAACANIIPAVHSIYRWKDKIETAGEVMVFFKTTPDRPSSFPGKITITSSVRGA
jgi:periplasmic divalent cation tolerance protein